MWQLIRFDLSYKKGSIILAYSIVSLFFAGNLFWNFGEIYPFMVSTTIAYFISIGVIGSEEDQEKRDRQHSLLPFPIEKLAVMRLVFYILMQVGMFVFWLLLYYLSYQKDSYQPVWIMLALNGFILSLTAIFAIYHDLGFFHTRKYRILFWIVVFTLATLFIISVGVGHFSSVEKFFSNIKVNTKYLNVNNIMIGAAFMNLFSLILLYTSRVIYIRRKSYVA